MSSITPPDIAQAMKSMGWPVASSLMKRWAVGVAWTMSDAVKLGTADPLQLPANQFDDTIVKMSWLSRFQRVKTAYDQVIGKATSDKALVVLKSRLATAGWKSGEFALGNVNMDARTLERTCQTNFVQFGSLTDTVDEFYGAIGKASVKVAVVGKVAVLAVGASKRHVFNVDKLGLYLRDTYDFNDDGYISQPLGVWSKERCLSKGEMAIYYADKLNRLNPATWLTPPPYPGFEAVDNSTVREWRKSSGKGGDFVVYSDVAWVDSPIKQTMSRHALASTAIICGLLGYSLWAPKGLSRLTGATGHGQNCVVQVSPKGSYRVDICRPSLPYFSFSKQMPRFVRFYDQRSQKILAESDIVEMTGRGEVFWPQDGRLTILVGGGEDAPEVAVKSLDGK